MAAAKTMTNAEALQRLAAALDKLDKSLDRIAAPAPPIPPAEKADRERVDRARFGYTVLSGLMGRSGVGIPVVGATRTRAQSGSSISFSSLPARGRKVELRSGNSTEIVDITRGHAQTRIPADRPIDSVLVLGAKGQAVGIGPRLPAL